VSIEPTANMSADKVPSPKNGGAPVGKSSGGKSKPPESTGGSGTGSSSVEGSMAVARGDVVACPRCHAPNARDRKFCGHCGQSLWMPCTECGTFNGCTEIYCGNCGTNLVEKLEAHVHELSTALEEARRLKSEARFHRAEKLLTPIAERQYHHPVLADLVRQAEHELATAGEEYDQRIADSHRALEAAKLYASNREYERARCALDAVPPSLRDENFQDLMNEVVAISEEITQLTFEIRRAVHKQQFDDLLPKVERLLELRPGDPKLLRLLAQLKHKRRGKEAELRDRLCQSAKRALAKFQYQQAAEQIRMVPPSVQTVEVARLQEHVEECAWLWNDLRASPYLDEPLLAIAERLVKLQPGDKRPGQILQEVKRRMAAPAPDARMAARPWARPPKRSSIGCPVEWIGGFRKIQVREPEVAATLQKNAGRFFVAAGLALQGLGRARLDINLLPRPKRSVLSLLASQTRAKHRPAESAWGFDLSPTGIKAVHLRWEEGVPVMDQCELVAHAKNLNRPDADAEQETLISDSMTSLLEKIDVEGSDRVCVGIPSPKVLGRFINLPPTARDKISEAMQYEAKHQIPLPLDTLVWDYQLLDEDEEEEKPKGLFGKRKEKAKDKEKDKEKEKEKDGEEAAQEETTRAERETEPKEMRRAVLAAAEVNEVHLQLGHFQQADIDVDVIQSDAIALANFLNYEYLDSPDQQPVLLADIGAATINIVVVSPVDIWFRSVGYGADEFAKCMMRDFNLTFSRAEAVKRTPTAARNVHKIYEVLSAEFEAIFNEVQRSIDSFATTHDGRRVSRILAIGGGFRMHGLVRHFVVGPLDSPPQS